MEQCRNIQETDQAEGRHATRQSHRTDRKVRSFQKDRRWQKRESKD